MSLDVSLRDRIGPNAILQIIEAVTAAKGESACEALFSFAGLSHYLANRPTEMVSERDVATLQRALREQFGAEDARALSWDAGLRTGDYLLANRIPRFAQVVLRFFPASMAARVLAGAIAKHSWTFAGSGSFSFTPGTPFVFRILNNPLCSQIKAIEPACDFYAATFERIFRAIVHPNSRVVETECEASGGEACVFEVRW
jgi:divinyl protochlorophyllide a 8-vinyl-reductase